jgi:hypothetical protein
MSTAHSADMTELQPVAGQLVCVATPQLDGGEPILALYVIAERNPATAEKIIKDRIGLGEQVTGMWPLPPSAIMAFRLKPGQFTLWRDRP